jgi:hypothetical protein
MQELEHQQELEKITTRLDEIVEQFSKLDDITEEKFDEMTIDQLEKYDILLTDLEEEYEELLNDYEVLDFLVNGSHMKICPEKNNKNK